MLENRAWGRKIRSVDKPSLVSPNEGGAELSERLMSRREVAEYLDVPEATLARWAYAGGGPSYFRVGRHTRYRYEDVISWLEKNRSPDLRAAR